MTKISLLTISLIIIAFLAGMALILPFWASKTGTGTIFKAAVVNNATITKDYCLTQNLDEKDFNSCKNKFYTIPVKKTPQADMLYINLDLLNRFEAGKLGIVKVDPKCKKDCVITLEHYEMIKQLNRYMKENGVYFLNITPKDDYIKILVDRMRADKMVYNSLLK